MQGVVYKKLRNLYMKIKMSELDRFKFGLLNADFALSKKAGSNAEPRAPPVWFVGKLVCWIIGGLFFLFCFCFAEGRSAE